MWDGLGIAFQTRVLPELPGDHSRFTPLECNEGTRYLAFLHVYYKHDYQADGWAVRHPDGRRQVWIRDRLIMDDVTLHDNSTSKDIRTILVNRIVDTDEAARTLSRSWYDRLMEVDHPKGKRCYVDCDEDHHGFQKIMDEKMKGVYRCRQMPKEEVTA
jgi:hypothetical protein